MNIEKLPSGSYRISENRNGKRYRETVDHKPSKAEARDIISKMIGSICDSTPFYRAADSYIKLKENVLSPSTIRGYRSIIKNVPDNFLNMPLEKIDLVVIQSLINNYSLSHSSKSVRNLFGFVSAVLKFYGIDAPVPRLPQKEKKIDYIPTEQDIKRILAMAKGTEYEVSFILATFGLRRSEICALTLDDLKGNVLKIDKALVQDENKVWVIKKTKTTDSTRELLLPEYLVELIREKGFFEGNPDTLYNILHKYQKRLGIPAFSFHKLRHFFASYLHDLGYSDKQIQILGGWKTDNMLKTVYQHAMRINEVKENAASDLGNLLF